MLAVVQNLVMTLVDSALMLIQSSNTELVKNYASWFDLPYAISYFYNIYGKNEIADGEYATLIAIFKKDLSKEKNLTVVEPGSQRNFILMT